jgi:regulator of RNase E activity RraA
MPETKAELAGWLRRLDVCAISDALDQLGLPPAVTGLAPRTVRKRIAGQVVTVKLAAGSPASGLPGKHLCTAAIEAAQPGDVVVVEQRTGLDAAGWGGILSNAACMRGLAGVIVEGHARDVDEAADLAFPIYARGQTARTARGRVHEVATGAQIMVGDVQVQCGDWVVADSSGVAFVPASEIERVLGAAERIARREALMTQAVLEGQPVSQVMGADYERMLQTPSRSEEPK